jgi:hypothetical protein
MPHCTRTKEDVAGRVADMFRLAERDHGLTLKRLSLLSSMSYDTLNEYRKGAAIPLHAFVQIAPHMPDELLTLCLEPADKAVVSGGITDGALDELAEEAADYLAEYTHARSPSSPGGAQIIPMERAKLSEKARKVGAKARRAAL